MEKIQLSMIDGFDEMKDIYFICRDGDRCWVEGWNGKVLKSVFNNGYRRIGLYNKIGKQKNISEHRLFASAFIPNPDQKPIINHIDNNPGNNLLSNLEWCTQSENILHAVRQNRWVDNSGEKHGNSKISSDQVKQIFELSQNGLSQRKIAAIINCDQSHISRILSGRYRSKG